MPITMFGFDFPSFPTERHTIAPNPARSNTEAKLEERGICKAQSILFATTKAGANLNLDGLLENVIRAHVLRGSYLDLEIKGSANAGVNKLEIKYTNPRCTSFVNAPMWPESIMPRQCIMKGLPRGDVGEQDPRLLEWDH